MNEIKNKGNSYGVLVGLLLLIIIVLISYIAYSKGLEKNKNSNLGITTTTKSIPKINEEYTLEKLCQEGEDCNKKITTLNLENGDLNISIKAISENELITHNILITGKVEKTINLKEFKSLKIIDSLFIIIKSSDTNSNDKLTLYDNSFNKLDEISIYNTQNETYKNLEITYYTFDENCSSEENNYLTTNKAHISSNGFTITSSVKSDLKNESFTCEH